MDLTDDDYRTILKNYSGSDDVGYISSKCAPLGGWIPGFMGDYSILEINHLKGKQIFFVKSVPTHTEKQQEVAENRNCYRKEIFFYGLLKEYEKFGLNTDFAPKSYYCKDDKILVMENLITEGYILSEKQKNYSLEQLKSGLEALAQFHASSILYEENMSKKVGRKFMLQQEYPEMFKENYLDARNDELFSKILFEGTMSSINYVINNFKHGDRNDFKKHLNSENILKSIYSETDLRKATGHGDLWHNNIFFKYQDSKPVHCKIIDYQVLRYSVPALDVLILIYVNTNKQFRTTHIDQLLTFYYDTMSDIFAQHGYQISKILPLKQFKQSLKFAKTTAVYSALSIGRLIFLPSDIMEEFYKNGMGKDNWGDVYGSIFPKALKNDTFRTKIVDLIDDIYLSLVGDNNNA